MRKNYIGDDEQIARINSKVGKNDTIIFLGDIGNEEMIRKVRGYKVLIMGNHDKGASKYKRVITRMSFDSDQYSKDEVYDIASKKYPDWKTDIREDRAGNLYLWVVTADNGLFDEVYEGPLFIAEKLILSHEPIDLPYAFNIHGHEHRYIHRDHNLNVCAEHIDYYPVNVNRLLKNGLASKVDSIHRQTIDRATDRKNTKRAYDHIWDMYVDEFEDVVIDDETKQHLEE
jgi:calcineurin-like phosphoesterase family protein